MKIFLGVDGGQSYTKAVIADEKGNVLGSGTGIGIDHAERLSGRERLEKGVIDSVCEALRIKSSEFKTQNSFKAAHFGMSGGADYKESIIRELINAEHLTVGHDAATALFGATAGKGGIVVISGTGSFVYGENEKGEIARASGLGYIFSDEGSGFWLAVQTIRLAIKEQDGVIENVGLEKIVLDYFNVEKIRDLTTAFYNEKIMRAEIAEFAKIIEGEALAGNEILKSQIKLGAECLMENVKAVAKNLKFEKDFSVCGVGGMFQGELLRKYFGEALAKELPKANFAKPCFSPTIGALLLAYRSANIEISEELLKNLEQSAIKL